MRNYLQTKKVSVLPKIPLEGGLDLTYRCNNNCRHCWLWIPVGSPKKNRELTLEEIKSVIEEARGMGCCKWAISGGEPMLRPDFPEIIDYITRRAVSYSLNTNGTLISHKIAQLLRRKGNSVVALYGATSDVHDHITRKPGSFQATMQGFAYLKEAGADFIVQIIPMKDNYHQFRDMVNLAESLSHSYKIGSPWLYLSADGDPERNREILRQRLEPRDVIELDKPDPSYEEWMEKEEGDGECHIRDDNRFFSVCTGSRHKFHIDPYGQMTFCSFIQDSFLRYDLRKGNFKECWEVFIPSLPDKVRSNREYMENCGSCEQRKDCRWCPAYGYLEHRRLSAKVEYLCTIAKETRKFKEDWQKNHCRFYRSGGITIQVESDLPITNDTFHPKFKLFQVDGPGEDNITIRHHFSLPNLNGRDLGKEVYRKPPWAIYKKGNSWIYAGISSAGGDEQPHQVVVFNHDHTRARIYNDREETFRKGGVHSLTLFPTDQILLARVLADRKGCYMHASGVDFEGNGLLFVGHSEAGKSTVVRMLKDKAEILCDDRIILRRHPEGFRIYGTWCHGEIPEVSATSSPLKAILFLEKAKDNRLVLVNDRQEITGKLLACLIKPFESADWWDKILSLIGRAVSEVPCYSLYFDKSGRVRGLLTGLLENRQ
jgi:MoaA/NifB/PqqE/SkfB family radical SAM enzyme